MASHDSNTIIKFADDAIVESLITNNDETYHMVRDLAMWCQDNNLSLNVIKTKKFLGVNITNKLSWSKHTKTVVKRARQILFPRRRLKRFDMGPQILKMFYSCTIESILNGCITTWCGNCSAYRR